MAESVPLRMSAAPQHYRPELDGLRAIAVLAVIVFHLNPAWLPGGFAGVDVFFVLSGYLVSSIIFREKAAGSFSFFRFYQRRIARIFPAFLTMALATLLAAKLCYSTWDYAAAGSSFSAALLSIANFHQLSLGDYFQLSSDSQPLLHCWSLSVEEQFYLIFPILLGFILKAPPRARRLLISGLTLASFTWCLYLTNTRPVHAFYLLPSRAWELLAGSLLALASPLAAHARRPSFALAGLAAVCLTGVILHEGRHFPGWQALLPVLGTVAIIRYGGSTGPARSFLAIPLLVLIGRLSYSLYLWHWPVFSFIDYTLLYQSPATRLFLKITLTLLAASLCYRFIEQPVRTWLNTPHQRRPAFALLAASLVCLAPLGYAIRSRHYLDASDGSHGVLRFPQPQATGTLILMGDSQGTMYGQLARDLATAHQLNLIILSTAGEDPLLNPQGESSSLYQTSLDTIRSEKPACVILACHWIYKLKDAPNRLAATLESLQPDTRKIIILTQPPLLPPAAERAAIRHGSRPPFFETEADNALRHRLNQIVQQSANGNITVLDTNPFFVRPDGSLILEDTSGYPLFHDKVHLSTHGANCLKAALSAAMP